MKKKIELSSGNVFADLNLPNPEEILAKAELVRQIHGIIKKKKLTQKQAAIVLGIDQPKISALISGRLAGFSLERIMRFLNELGHDVTINVKMKALVHKKGSIAVTSIDDLVTSAPLAPKLARAGLLHKKHTHKRAHSFKKLN